MSDSFRARLRRGDRLNGLIVAVDSPEVVEMLSAVGFDWLFIDGEHSPLSPASLQRLIMAAGRTPCVVRVPAHDEFWIKQVLDAGAAGIIAPMVNTAEQARTVVARAKYPPLGRRGVGTSRAQAYGYGIADYIARANDEVAVIVQAEHRDALGEIDMIAATPGVDALFVGPFDLALSMGKSGQVDDPAVVDAIARIEAAGRAHGLALGYFGITPESVARWMERGFSLIACGVDMMMLGAKAREVLAALERTRGS
jgi:2-keto-3-deoxy-L-rhamnonate aldolase RhmA